MPFAPKNPFTRFPTLPTLVTLAAGVAAALAVQFYRRPSETVTEAARISMLLKGVREEICDVDGFPIHYYYAGRRGTPLIFIHGLGASAESWALLMPRLSREYLVYAPDLPGFGKTPLAPEGFNIRTHVLYIRRFLDALGYPQVTLVGNSLGAWIATRFAVEYPRRVKRLYLLNSAGLRRENGHSPYATDRAAAHRSIERIQGRRIPMRLPGFLLDAMVGVSQRPAYKGFIDNYDPQEELDSVLAQVQVPTTIIWGMQDGLFPITCAHDFHSGITNSELILLPGVGHVPQTQATAEVARVILEDRGK
ncbi:MAG: alpha/beta fold hydrolase [Ktedonobacteraceae bacterium]